MVTPEEVSEQLNFVEGLKRHVDIDDNFLAAVLANQVKLARIESRENELLDQLIDLTRAIDPGVDTGMPNKYPWEFSTDVSANTTTDSPATTTRPVPFDSRIESLIVGWPDGANGLVGVQFRTESGERFFPRNAEDEYIAANDFTHPFDLRTSVDADETLTAEFINNDPNNDHFVNVIAMLEER